MWDKNQQMFDIFALKKCLKETINKLENNFISIN